VTPAKEGLLSTIRALLEMTESRGCTKAEAVAARGKALNLMRKYGVTVEDLEQASPSGALPQATTFPPPVSPIWQETDSGKRAAYDYWSTHGFYSNDAFASEFLSRRSGRGRRPLPRLARVIAGFGIAGLAVLIIGDIGQIFTSDVRAIAPSTAPQARVYVNRARTFQERMDNGEYARFTLGADGKIVGLPTFSSTPWPDTPFWQD
jgi:hypothetical protein